MAKEKSTSENRKEEALKRNQEIKKAVAILEVMSSMNAVMESGKPPTPEIAKNLLALIEKAELTEEFEESVNVLKKYSELNSGVKKTPSEFSEKVDALYEESPAIANCVFTVEKKVNKDGKETLAVSFNSDGFTTLELMALPSLLEESMKSQEN